MNLLEYCLKYYFMMESSESQIKQEQTDINNDSNFQSLVLRLYNLYTDLSASNNNEPVRVSDEEKRNKSVFHYIDQKNTIELKKDA